MVMEFYAKKSQKNQGRKQKVDVRSMNGRKHKIMLLILVNWASTGLAIPISWKLRKQEDSVATAEAYH